jgi:hypothetical protein
VSTKVEQAPANMGHAFGIFMAHVDTLHSLRSLRRRLPWALGILRLQALAARGMACKKYGNAVGCGGENSC